jgi:hypothetical protein
VRLQKAAFRKGRFAKAGAKNRQRRGAEVAADRARRDFFRVAARVVA